MANENKIISFWKRVKLKSSDMFTLFRVGIGVKVPTNKLHVKDSSNPLKVEGMTVVGGSSGVEGYSIVQADSDGVFYTALTTGGVAINDLYDHSGAVYLTAGGSGSVIIAGDLTVSGNDIIFEGATADEYETKLTAADTTGSDKTLTLPNLTGTIATTDVAGGGTGAATFTSNAILTGNGTSAIQAESTLTYNGEVLSIGVDDSGFVNLSRIDHSDGAGGNFQILAGSAGGDNTAGGSLKLYAGYGKGSGGGGDIQFISNGTSGTASTTPTPAVVAVISKEGNLQIDGGLTVGSTSFVNSSGVVQVATQGTIDHDSLANFVTAEHVDWAGSSAGTVHSSNIPTLNQDTTGTAATVTAGTQAAITTCANLVTTGTIGTGVWQGTDVGVAYGGTGVSTLTSNAILTGNGSSAIQAESNVTISSDMITANLGGLAGPLKLDYTYVDAIEKAQGIIVYIGGTTGLTAGGTYYLSSSTETWVATDADAAASATGMIGLALGTASDTHGMLLQGVGMSAADAGNMGEILYLSTTSTRMTSTAPSGSGDIVRVMGYSLHDTSKLIYFNPDSTWVEIA